MPPSIGIVVDHHSGALGGGRGEMSAVDLAPATQQLLREASQLHIPVRFVVPEPLDDPHSHPDNARVVDALLAELTEMGHAPFTHEFAFSGRILRNVIADHPGSGGPGGSDPGLVVLGCHLDSTAARDPGYEPTSDPARGADDDASGMAALLAIARHLRSLPDPLLRTVRLGFFNAEESGLVGSRAYAASLKRAGTAIGAVVCCDMIAFNSDGLRTFEVHAGFTDPAVRDLSVPLADVVARSAPGLTVLVPAQVYTGTTQVGRTDPTRFDGAINRSDTRASTGRATPPSSSARTSSPTRPASRPPIRTELPPQRRCRDRRRLRGRHHVRRERRRERARSRLTAGRVHGLRTFIDRPETHDGVIGVTASPRGWEQRPGRVRRLAVVAGLFRSGVQPGGELLEFAGGDA